MVDTLATVSALIDTNLADNTNGSITPALHRAVEDKVLQYSSDRIDNIYFANAYGGIQAAFDALPVAGGGSTFWDYTYKGIIRVTPTDDAGDGRMNGTFTFTGKNGVTVCGDGIATNLIYGGNFHLGYFNGSTDVFIKDLWADHIDIPTSVADFGQIYSGSYGLYDVFHCTSLSPECRFINLDIDAANRYGIYSNAQRTVIDSIQFKFCLVGAIYYDTLCSKSHISNVICDGTTGDGVVIAGFDNTIENIITTGCGTGRLDSAYGYGLKLIGNYNTGSTIVLHDSVNKQLLMSGSYNKLTGVIIRGGDTDGAEISGNYNTLEATITANAGNGIVISGDHCSFTGVVENNGTGGTGYLIHVTSAAQYAKIEADVRRTANGSTTGVLIEGSNCKVELLGTPNIIDLGGTDNILIHSNTSTSVSVSGTGHKLYGNFGTITCAAGSTGKVYGTGTPVGAGSGGWSVV